MRLGQLRIAGGYKEKGNIIPFFLVNRRFAFNNISFGKPGTEVNIGAAFGTNGRYLALSVSLPQIGHLCTLTTLPALTALSAAFEIGEPAVQTAVSDAEQGAAADVDAARIPAGFPRIFPECGIYPSYGSPVPGTGRAFCRKFVPTGSDGGGGAEFQHFRLCLIPERGRLAHRRRVLRPRRP